MQIINRTLKRFIRLYYRLRNAIDGQKTNQKLIIISSDGGVCSQIAFWALGLFYEQRDCQVKYEIAKGGYRNPESEWEEIHRELVEAMARMDKVLTPLIDELEL